MYRNLRIVFYAVFIVLESYHQLNTFLIGQFISSLRILQQLNEYLLE
jgi:hypothetical protein